MNRVTFLTAASCAALLCYASSGAHAGLIGYWNLDGQADDQAGSNDLTAIGDATYAASINPGLGQAGEFDGDGDGFISNTYEPVTGNDLTVVAWVHANSLPVWATIAKNWSQTVGSQFHFGVNGASGILSDYADSGGQTSVFDSTAVPTGEWVHTAAVLDSSTLEHRLYLNGSLVGTSAYDGDLGAAAHNVFGIGIKPDDAGTGPSDPAWGPGPWDGLIDEVGVYDSALSSGNIAAVISGAQQGTTLDQIAVPEPAGLGVLLAITSFGGAAFTRRRRA